MLLTLVIKIGIAVVLLAALATFMICAIVCAALGIRDAITDRRRRREDAAVAAATGPLAIEPFTVNVIDAYIDEWRRQNS